MQIFFKKKIGDEEKNIKSSQIFFFFQNKKFKRNE
jgi:hypothetical protein